MPANLTYPSVAWFFPAWNEANNLTPLVERAVAHFNSLGSKFQIFIIDDGSTDHTIEIAEKLVLLNPGLVTYCKHDVNRGYGATVRTGLAYGYETGFDLVGYCDGDGQFDITEVDRLIAASVGHDIVAGYRVDRADSLQRRLMGRAWHLLSHVIVGVHITDVDCGFKLFRTEALDLLLADLAGNHATISPEIMTRAARLGLKFAEVPVSHYPREHGEQTGANLKVVLHSLASLLSLRWQLRNYPVGA